MQSESNSSAVDVERMRSRIRTILRQAVRLFAPHSNFTRDNLLLCGADMMKHSKIVVLAYSLAHTTRTRSRILAVRGRQGQHHPHSDTYV